MKFNVSLKTVRSVTLGLILLALGFGVGYTQGQSGEGNSVVPLPKKVVNTGVPQEYKEVDFSLFWEVWEKMENEYLDPEKLDVEDMVYGAIKGMVSSAGDPYTVFLPPQDQSRTAEDLSGSFKGVGIQLGYRDNQLAVIAPLKGMPAEKAGVKAGDLILNIVDETKSVDADTQNMSLPEAVNLIRGEGGVLVTLTLFRENNGRPFDVEIVRDTIVVPSVELAFVPANGTVLGVEDSDPGSFDGGSVAHLALFRFGERTESEWNEAVDEILERGDLKGVVLDLRNNPGGFLNGSIFVASEFIDQGTVVKQQGRQNSETYSVNRRGRLIGKPLVVLVNQGSASASEIVAGALRDRLGVKLVGTKTFGKGTVQSADTLRGGTGTHITTARWLLPGGDWIHEEGIAPDVEASDSGETANVDEMLETAVGLL